MDRLCFDFALARLDAATTATLELRLNQFNYDHDITCTYTSEMDPFYHDIL
jgi:hypothetical protein